MHVETPAALHVDTIASSGVYLKNLNTNLHLIHPWSIPYASKVQLKLQQRNSTHPASDLQSYRLNMAQPNLSDLDLDQGSNLQREDESDREMVDGGPDLQDESDVQIGDGGDLLGELREEDVRLAGSAPETMRRHTTIRILTMPLGLLELRRSHMLYHCRMAIGSYRNGFHYSERSLRITKEKESSPGIDKMSRANHERFGRLILASSRSKPVLKGSKESSC
ncbi:hypothetical protein BT69DRAFT_1298311 [Atractiella rhizophila]|nr:hypothetical protein BT69DRAFT_1298311 [Atractiella rhizophila]